MSEESGKFGSDTVTQSDTNAETSGDRAYGIIHMINSSKDRYDLSTNQMFSVGFYVLVAGSLALIFNMLGCIIYYKFPGRFLNAENTPRAGLLFSNTIMSLLLAILGATVTISQENVARVTDLLSCQIVASVLVFFGLMEINMTAFIAFQQFTSTCSEPYGQSRIRTEGQYPKVLGQVALFSLFWAMVPLIGYSRYAVTPYSIECAIDWFKPDMLYSSYITSMSIFCFILPLGITLYCYESVRRHLHSSTDFQTCRMRWVSPNHVGKYVITVITATFGSYSLYGLLCVFPLIHSPTSISAPIAVCPYIAIKSLNFIQSFVYVFMDLDVRECMLQLISGKDHLQQQVESTNDDRSPVVAAPAGESSSIANSPSNHNMMKSTAAIQNNEGDEISEGWNDGSGTSVDQIDHPIQIITPDAYDDNLMINSEVKRKRSNMSHSGGPSPAGNNNNNRNTGHHYIKSNSNGGGRRTKSFDGSSLLSTNLTAAKHPPQTNKNNNNYRNLAGSFMSHQETTSTGGVGGNQHQQLRMGAESSSLLGSSRTSVNSNSLNSNAANNSSPVPRKQTAAVHHASARKSSVCMIAERIVWNL